MNRSLDRLLAYFDRNSLRREVEEELQFHIEMQARDYDMQGLTREESLANARLRFGDFEQIKSQCVQIGSRNSARMGAMRILLTLAFLLGVFIRSLNADYHVTRMGNVLIMIAVLGGLLLMGKRMRTGYFRPAPEPLRLGLHRDHDSIPPAFDEEGRTPFERVRGAE